MQMKEKQVAKPGYELKVYATRWGFSGSMDAFCQRVKAEGFDGVEDWIPGDEKEEDALFEALAKHDLSFGALAGSTGEMHKNHLDSYDRNLKKALSHQPDFINSHAGRDFFSFQQNMEIIELSNKTGKTTTVPIYHETHRGRMLFAAHVAEKFIAAQPQLKLTLDISHWCAVAESLLANQALAVDAALKRTAHIHARIGHEEGPQVSEPRAPEWQRAAEAHFAWWDKVVSMKKAVGERLTVTTEFGPSNYMWSTPYTRQPLADQWDINVYMMQEFRSRYA